MVSGEDEGMKKRRIGSIKREVWAAEAILLEKKKISAIQNKSGP